MPANIRPGVTSLSNFDQLISTIEDYSTLSAEDHESLQYLQAHHINTSPKQTVLDPSVLSESEQGGTCITTSPQLTRPFPGKTVMHPTNPDNDTSLDESFLTDDLRMQTRPSLAGVGRTHTLDSCVTGVTMSNAATDETAYVDTVCGSPPRGLGLTQHRSAPSGHSGLYIHSVRPTTIQRTFTESTASGRIHSAIVHSSLVQQLAQLHKHDDANGTNLSHISTLLPRHVSIVFSPKQQTSV
jgi:hypothetical protein